ncbi:MAG: hypothetical protein ABIH46_09575 [Chloroflexota bacterium]
MIMLTARLSPKKRTLAERIGLAALVLTAVVTAGCLGDDDVPHPTATATPVLEVSPSPATLLGSAVERFQDAESYKFTISAIHTWSFEGKTQDWVFKGEGASSGNKFRSLLEGPADSWFYVKHTGDTIEAWDTQGEIANPSSTFGAPGFGTAPYTAIAYLREFKEAASASAAADIWHLTFKPDLAAVAAIDAAHADALKRVKRVEGEVWVTKDTGAIEKETVRVEFEARSGVAQTFAITLEFYDYNQPVLFD